MSYFVGGSAGGLNFVTNAFLLLGTPLTVFWAVVAHFYWGRKAVSKPAA